MRTFKSRFVICLAVVGYLTAAGSPAAQAGNIVPNPSFELGCTTAGDTPDGWADGVGPQGPGGTIACSTKAKTGAGTFGMLVHQIRNLRTAATSNCVSVSLSGSYAASFSSSVTTGANAGSRVFDASFYSDSNCQTGSGSSARLQDDSPPSPTGDYATVSGTMTAPPSTNSVLFTLAIQCADTSGNICSPDTADVVFDDLSFEVSPTAVTFRSLSAGRTPNGVVVRWRTAFELGTLGFHVYRELEGRRVRVTSRLIPAKAGGFYSFVDRRAPKRPGLRYWIQKAAADGSRRWYGPARVLARRA